MTQNNWNRSNYSRPSSTSDQDDESLKGPTMNLVLVNVIFYILTSLIGGNFFRTQPVAIVLFGFSIETFLLGLVWTPITAIFAHSGITHIGGNMIFLFIYGFKLEEMGYSDRGIYLSYLITGILSTIVSAPLIGWGTISLGASGSVLGLLGTVAGIQRRQKDPTYRSVLFASIILFILSSTSPRTNIFAHLFGLIFGFILGNSQFFSRFKD